MDVAATLAVLMLLGGQAGSSASPATLPDQPPVSLERVHEGMHRPTLRIPPIDPLPVFRGSVEVDLPLDTPLEAMRRELAADSGYSGRRGIDVLGAVMGIVKSIKSARRARAEADIRKEVQAELNAFCAEHDCSALEDGPPPIEGVIIPRKRAIE